MKRRYLVVVGVMVWGLGMLLFSDGFAQQVKTLKIGGTNPLNINFGAEAKKCSELIVDNINKTGGLVIKGQRYNLSLTIYDDKNTPDGGKSGVERLIYRDQCKYIVTMVTSPPTYAAVAVTEPEKALLISPCATDRIVRPEFKYTVRTGHLPSVVAARWSYVAKKYPKVKTYAIIAPDDEAARGSTKEQKQALASFGKNMVDEVYYPHGTTDFSAVATRVKSANPDFVIFPASAGETDFALQIKSLYDSGYRGLRVAELFNTEAIKRVATNEQIEGIVAPLLNSELPRDKRNPNNLLIEKLYTEKYGTFSPMGVTWVKPLYTFLAAVKKANSLEIDDIMAALTGLTFSHGDGEGMMVKRPDLGVNRYGDFLTSYDLGVVRNGRVVYDESLSLTELLETCQRIFGGSWR
jgi:ABC-type branched-subunit amino acid transport system substrate-binding protein